jgi:hypothetical protein
MHSPGICVRRTKMVADLYASDNVSAVVINAMWPISIQEEE